jgi:hypothetical protein
VKKIESDAANEMSDMPRQFLRCLNVFFVCAKSDKNVSASVFAQMKRDFCNFHNEKV